MKYVFLSLFFGLFAHAQSADYQLGYRDGLVMGQGACANTLVSCSYTCPKGDDITGLGVTKAQALIEVATMASAHSNTCSENEVRKNLRTAICKPVVP